MDDKHINKMYLDRVISGFNHSVVNTHDKTSILADIAKTWRQIKPEGAIGDEQIKKLEEFEKNVFQACTDLENKLSDNEDIENLPEDYEKIKKLLNDIDKLSDNMHNKYSAFHEWYSKLYTTFFNEEYKK